MKPEKITINAFCVIGKSGFCENGNNIAGKLWDEANAHFAEVAPLAKKTAEGGFAGFWGAMSRADMSFMPWEDDFSKGLYMAGVEADEDAVAPKGWRKWIVPGFDCLKVKTEGPETFRQTLDWMKENGFELVAAVQDFTDPASGQGYMLFPIAWNDSKKALIARQKAKTDPIAPCGFNCDGCFMTEWCGNCRSACNMCSYATLFDDNRCENEKCTKQKGLYGCWECDELEACAKGFYSAEDASICKANALFIKKHGVEEYKRALIASGEQKVEMKRENSAEENVKLLETLI